MKDLGWWKYTENKKYFTFSLPGACLLWITYSQWGVMVLFLKKNCSLIYRKWNFWTEWFFLQWIAELKYKTEWNIIKHNLSLLHITFPLLPQPLWDLFFQKIVKLGGSQGLTTGTTITEKQSDTFNFARPCSFPLIFQQDPREAEAELSLFSPPTLIRY